MPILHRCKQACIAGVLAFVLGIIILGAVGAGAQNAPQISTPAASSPTVQGSAGPSPADSPPNLPRGYALVVGINDYPGTANDLTYCVPDAAGVITTLRGEGFAPGDVYTLNNSAATEPAISAKIAQVAARMDGNDVFVMYYSGHGSYDIGSTAPGTCAIHTPHPYANNYYATWTVHHEGALAVRVRFDSFNVESGYDIGFVADPAMYGYTYTGNKGTFWSDWITGDTCIVGIDADYIVTAYGFDVTAYEVATSFDCSIIPYDFETNEGMYGSELNASLAGLPKGSMQLLFFDSCMSGGLLAPLSAPNRAVMSACAANEYSVEDAGLKHGVFTYYFLEAFAKSGGRYSHDTSGDGHISVGEIFAHAASRTTNYAYWLDNPQHPQLLNNLAGAGTWDFDADGDGLLNWEETDTYHTDPTKADTDGDGLTDYVEIMTFHTDPLQADTDGDGFDDPEEIENDWDPRSWASPWSGIIAGIVFGAGIPAVGIGYGLYRHRHPVAHAARPSPSFAPVAPAQNTSLVTSPAPSRFAPAYHAHDATGRLVPMFRGHTASEWGALAGVLDRQGCWQEAVAAAEIARQLGRAEANPPAWVHVENERVATLNQRPALPTTATTPVFDTFLRDPAPVPDPAAPVPPEIPPEPAPQNLHSIPAPATPSPGAEEVIVPPIPDPEPVPAFHAEPAAEIIPLCRLCGSLVRNGECERCGGKVCPNCQAANYATNTSCRKCLAPL